MSTAAPSPLAYEASADMCRDAIAEQLGYLATHIGCASAYLDINDDAGLAYSLRCGKAHFRAALQADDMLRKARRELGADTNRSRVEP